MISTFRNCETKLKTCGIDFQRSGTTCNTIFIQGNNVTICNLGNSRSVLCRVVGKQKFAIEQSSDHNADNKNESNRILENGGIIEKLHYNNFYVGPTRVWENVLGPGLSCTRALGNFRYKKIGILATPEISHFELKYGDKFIITASDGLWDVMTSTEACAFVLKNMYEEDPSLLLVKEAKRQWKTFCANKKINNWISDLPFSKTGFDDITVIISFFVYAIDEDPIDFITKE